MMLVYPNSSHPKATTTAHFILKQPSKVFISSDGLDRFTLSLCKFLLFAGGSWDSGSFTEALVAAWLAEGFEA